MGADAVERLAELLDDARHGVALTGAGVSTESGIPDFRSDSGLWKGVDPAQVASRRGFDADPDAFYRFWREKFGALADAVPNVTHRLLSDLESRGRIQAVVTQNIDGLHARAGSRRVLEVHGTFQTVRCLACGDTRSLAAAFASGGEGAPRCRHCGGLLKPDVVLFDEELPPAFEQAQSEVAQCDLLLVLGSSLEVYPVAGLVPLAKRSGATLALVNRDPGPFDHQADLVIHAELGPTMRELAALLGA